MERKLSLVSCTTEDVLWLYMPPAAVLTTPAKSALVARHTNSEGHRRHLRLTAAIDVEAGAGTSVKPNDSDVVVVHQTIKEKGVAAATTATTVSRKVWRKARQSHDTRLMCRPGPGRRQELAFYRLDGRAWLVAPDRSAELAAIGSPKCSIQSRTL